MCQAQPAAPVVSLKTRDLGLYIGHFHERDQEREDPFDYDSTSDAALATAGVGFYWTENVKTEVEVGRTSEARTSGSLPVVLSTVPGGFRIYTNNRTTATVVSVAQSYQFFHNQWFHPFVTAGADVAFERTRVETPQQFYYPPPIYGPIGTPPQYREPVLIPARPIEVRRRTEPRAFGGVGFKAYVTQRAFFRSDLRVASGEGRTVTARVGFGVDF